jgi:hypothetical protein
VFLWQGSSRVLSQVRHAREDWIPFDAVDARAHVGAAELGDAVLEAEARTAHREAYDEFQEEEVGWTEGARRLL